MGLLSCGVGSQPSLLITEVMSNNRGGVRDQFYQLSDWIEITNVGDTSVELYNIYLTDNIKNMKQWKVPVVMLQPNESLTIFASGQDLRAFDEPIHANFKINKNGEQLYLMNGVGQILDTIRIPELSPNISWGRDTDESSIFGYLLNPSFGVFVEQKPIEEVSASISNSLVLSEVQYTNKEMLVDEFGVFSDWIELHNTSGNALDASQFFLSDDINELQKWRLPAAKIPANGYTVIYASERNEGFHSSFKLSKSDVVILSDLNRQVLELVNLKYFPSGLLSKFAGEWKESSTPTPGVENNEIANSSKLQINEVYPFKGSSRREWIELYNGTNEPLMLSDFVLDCNRKVWELPKREIKPNGYAILTLSDLVKSDVDTTLSFRGEVLRLLTKDNRVVDIFRYGKMPKGISVGRNNTGEVVFWQKPSQNLENKGAYYRKYVSPPTVNNQSGQYTTPIIVNLSKPASQTVYYYTLDGSTPNRKDKRLTAPISISKNTVLRIKGYREGYLPSETAAFVYIFDNLIPLPVVSVLFEPREMFHSTRGIYSLGLNAEEEFPFKGANFWSNKEIDAQVLMMENKRGVDFDEKVTIRIFGGWSRGLEKKSFQVNARSSVGSAIFSYPFFERRNRQEMSHFILRSGGQDRLHYYFRDIFIFDLMRGLNFDSLDYKTVFLYLNDEFWGVYNIREKLDEEYLASLHHVDEESISIIDIGIDSTNSDWKKMISGLGSRKASNPKDYLWLESHMDIDSLIDMMLYHVFLANVDYGNTRAWKTEGGTWKFLLYDADLVLSSPYNAFNPLLKRGDFRMASVRKLLRWLIESDLFVTKLLKRGSELYHNKLTPLHFEDLLNSYELRYSNVIKQEYEFNKMPKNWPNEKEILLTIYKDNYEKVPSYFQKSLTLSDKQIEKYFSE
jgi:hypothetical protein